MKTLTFICIVVIAAMAATASVVIAEEQSVSAPAASVPGQIRHLGEQADDRESAANESLEAVEASAGMESYDTYDPNTGLPDTTPSDSVGDLN